MFLWGFQTQAVFVWPCKAEPIWGDGLFLCFEADTQTHTHTVTAHLLALLVRPCLAHVAMATRPYSPMRKRPLPLCEVGQKQFLKCSRTKLEL